MKNLFKILFIFIFLIGCAQSRTIPDNEKARIIDDQSNLECKFLDTVYGISYAGNSIAHDMQRATDQARYRAFKIGANAIKIIKIESNSESTSVLAQALKCKL